MKKISFIIILLFIFITACKRNSNNSSNANSDSALKIPIENNLQVENITPIDKDTTPNDTSFLEENRKKNISPFFVKYKIPGVSDYRYSVANTKPNFNILYSTSNKFQLTNTFQKSVLLGIISADLFYSATYGNANFTTKYFTRALELSDDLGISNIFTQDNLERVKLFENQDTVKKIISVSLETIYTQLYEAKAYNELPFLIYGAWLESVYLLTNTLIDNPDAPTELFKQLAQQKDIIQNLRDYYNNVLLDANEYETNLNIQNIIGELGVLDVFFNAKNSNQVYIIMNKEQMQNLIKAIEKLRNSIYVQSVQKIEQQQLQYQKSIEK